MTTLESMAAQKLKEKKIRAARKALRDCQQDRDAFLSRYPEHAEARRLYESQIKTLNGNLDRLIRGQ